jgi:hypothetical protein
LLVKGLSHDVFYSIILDTIEYTYPTVPRHSSIASTMAMNARSASQALRALRVRTFSERQRSVQNANILLANLVPAYRNYATSSEPDLKTTFKEAIPAKRELLKKVKALGGKVIGDVKVENTIGGMRYEYRADSGRNETDKYAED